MSLASVLSASAIAVTAVCATLALADTDRFSTETANASVTRAGYALVTPMERLPNHFVATVRDENDQSVRTVKIYRDGRVVEASTPMKDMATYELGKATFKALVGNNG